MRFKVGETLRDSFASRSDAATLVWPFCCGCSPNHHVPRAFNRWTLRISIYCHSVIVALPFRAARCSKSTLRMMSAVSVTAHRSSLVAG
jgi:surfactin synthase thioesterase subunit